MITLNAKLKERLSKGLKKYQPILVKAQSADINESDTVTIITDLLCDVFGYDKYENITSEYAIKKTYCDLAIKIKDNVRLLIECKAICLDLKDDYVRQATNYAANSGIEWVVLTNGIKWKVYKISFKQPIEKELVYEFDLLELSPKKESDLEALYYLSYEAFTKKGQIGLTEFYEQKQVFNRYVIGQFVLTDTIVKTIRRNFKKLFPDVTTSDIDVYNLMHNEIFKREITEGEAAIEAKKAIQKAERKLNSQKKKAQSEPAN